VTYQYASLNDYVKDNKIDLNPDLYSLVLPNGKFIEFTYDRNGNIIKSNQNLGLVTIERPSGSAIGEWIVTDSDGVKYYFGTTDTNIEIINEYMISTRHQFSKSNGIGSGISSTFPISK